MKESFSATVKRGENSWAYFYIFLGFALEIEGSVIQMSPLKFPYNVGLFIVLGVITGAIITNSGWLQNKLIGFKASYEEKER